MRIPRRLAIAAVMMAIVVGLAAAIGLLLLPAPPMWGSGKAGEGSPPELSLEELQTDFDRLVDTVIERHPLLYSNAERVAAISAEQRERLRDGMTAVDLYRVLAPVVEALECGHSNLQMGRDYMEALGENERLLPLRVEVNDGRLIVSESLRPEKLPTGSRVLAINDKEGEDILKMLLAGVTSDGTNRTSKIAKINRQFAYYYHLLVDDGESFRVRYTTREGETERLALLSGASATELFGPARELSSIGVYMDFSQMRHDFSGSVTAEEAYLRVGSFILAQREFADFLEGFFREVVEEGSETLTLDLRGNWGGPPRGSALLFSYLMEQPAPYLDETAPWFFHRYKRPLSRPENAFGGELTVLIDGAVFSTTAHLVSLLDHHNRGTLVGETTGGSAACTDSSRWLRLPHSGLRLYYATRVYSTPADRQSDGAGIAPDRRVTPTVEDLLRGKDPILKAALSG